MTGEDIARKGKNMPEAPLASRYFPLLAPKKMLNETVKALHWLKGTKAHKSRVLRGKMGRMGEMGTVDG